MPIHLSHATGGIASTNAWLIADDATGKAVLVDAPDHTIAPLLDRAERLKLDVIGLWLTHGHFDHIADHAIFRQRFPDAKVLIHPLDLPKLQRPAAQMFLLPFTIEPGDAHQLVNEGDILELGSLRAAVLHTPGHAPGHVCFHFQSEDLLVGGDLIIMNAIGRTDFPDSSPRDMRKSLRRIATLPASTTLLPGHGSPSTIGHELATNPYLQDAVEST